MFVSRVADRLRSRLGESRTRYAYGVAAHAAGHIIDLSLSSVN